MVSTTLATIASSSTESSNQHYQDPESQSQHQSGQILYTITGRTSAATIAKLQNNNPSGIEDEYNNSTWSSTSSSKIIESNHQSGAFIAISKNQTSAEICAQNEVDAAQLLSTSPPISEKISLLFPKCRPKNDAFGNSGLKYQSENGIGNQPDSLQASSSLSSESSPLVAPRNSTNPFLNINTSTETDQDHSRQSSLVSYNYPSKIVRTRDFQMSQQNASRKRSLHGSNQNPFVKDNYWEPRHNTTPVNTVLNSPELTENEMKIIFNQKQHIKVGKSPVGHSEINVPVDMDTPTRGVAVVADGEVVVFDDISENWQNLRVTMGHSGDETNFQHEQHELLGSSQEIRLDLDYTGYEYRNESERKRKFTEANFRKHAGMKHNIIEYEGSPRRIGQSSPEKSSQSTQFYLQRPKYYNAAPLHSVRPGFPQRVLAEASEIPTSMDKDIQKITSEVINSQVSELATSLDLITSEKSKSPTFDYLYEFSETRKVLEEFFKCPTNEEKPIENISDIDSTDIQCEFECNLDIDSISYLDQRQTKNSISLSQESNVEFKNVENGLNCVKDDDEHEVDLFAESASRSSTEILDRQDGENQNRIPSRAFRYSPETTDYDSNCGDLDSLSGDYNGISPYANYPKYHTSMPVLEDGLSSGHTSDTENNNQTATGISILMDVKHVPDDQEDLDIGEADMLYRAPESPNKNQVGVAGRTLERFRSPITEDKVFKSIDPDLDALYSINVFHRSDMIQLTPPPPAPAPHRKTNLNCSNQSQNSDVNLTALKEVCLSMSQNQQQCSAPNKIQGTPFLPLADKQQKILPSETASPLPPPPPPPPPPSQPADVTTTSSTLCSPVWIPRGLDNPKNNYSDSMEHHSKNLSADEEDVDTDLETDRLLGHQRLDDQGFYDEGKPWERKPRSLLTSSMPKFSPKVQPTSIIGSSLLRQGLNSLLPTTPELVGSSQPDKNNSKLIDIADPVPELLENSPEVPTDIKNCLAESPNGSNKSKKDSEKKGKKSKNKEVLIEGVLFRARYLGSTQLVCEGQPTKSTRMMQAEEAVSRIKAPDGEGQPSTEVDLFISTEKIMVLNTDLKEIMMDHALRTISYIADIGDLVVLMARRRFVPQDIDDAPKPNRTPKMICHVFESDEAQFIAQSIGQAFQVAYMEFLKANGIEDHSFVKEMDYQEVLNSQEIFGDELEIFAKKELQKEVVVPKAKGEILGVVIVESGWGSMLPTVVIANLMSNGAAARCGQLNIGDQLIAINGLSLVGLPLSTCQNYIKNTKNQTVVKFTVVPCAPVVEVKIKRPNTKYQLGFSVQNGVICSLLRGGIAERGGVRVGHRIIEINNQSVVAVPHEKIVNLLATSVGEILMKTMPTSMFRLLTGQENPIYI